MGKNSLKNLKNNLLFLKIIGIFAIVIKNGE